MSESLRENTEDNPLAKQWENLANQMASHSTVDGKGNTVYLGREVGESERAKVEESGFEKPAEPVRGSERDRDISEDVYPQLEGESDYDYRARINNMRAESLRDIMGDAVTDAQKTFHTTYADYMQGRATDEDWNKANKKLDLTKSLHEKGKL